MGQTEDGTNFRGRPRVVENDAGQKLFDPGFIEDIGTTSVDQESHD